MSFDCSVSITFNNNTVISQSVKNILCIGKNEVDELKCYLIVKNQRIYKDNYGNIFYCNQNITHPLDDYNYICSCRDYDKEKFDQSVIENEKQSQIYSQQLKNNTIYAIVGCIIGGCIFMAIVTTLIIKHKRKQMKILSQLINK
jgi:hypothetical protein